MALPGSKSWIRNRYTPLLAALLALTGCSGKQPPGYQGYVEGEFVHVSSSVAGRLDRLLVTRGQRVPANAPLFALESENETAAQRQARQQLSAAEAQLKDLRTGKRPQELDVIRAQLAQAVAEERKSAADLVRDEAQYKAGGISNARLDETRARAESDAARNRELRSQLDVAGLSAREEQIKAQTATAAAARAALEQAEWKLNQKAVAAPGSGLVFDTMYREGEWVQAGSPVVRLLPPGNIKVRFFVPRNRRRHTVHREKRRPPLRRLPGGYPGEGDLYLDGIGIYPPGHLQQRDPVQAGLHDRGASFRRQSPRPSPRPTRRGKGALSDGYAIDVKGLNKHFGDKHVVKDVSLQVRRGEIFGFLGPNGSGKTTTIRMMCGLLKPDSGSGTCLGYDIRRDSAQIKRHVGYMTQKFSYWDDLTIRENLDFVARMYGMPDRLEAVDRTLKGLGLTERANQLTGALSGGWKQRLALAACLLHDPELLLLDEPTAGVDPGARRDFWEELQRLSAAGISVLVSTHYMDEAERCHKLAYIAYGRLLAQGTSQEVIAAQGLITWAIYDGNLAGLSETLQKLPGVEQTVLFGAMLHVSGIDGDLLERTLRAATAGTVFRMEKVDTSLEDVFIYKMKQSADRSGTGT